MTARLLPGAPVAFSLRSSDKHVYLPAFGVKLGASNIVHRVENGQALLPEANDSLAAEVAYTSPEHVQATPEMSRVVVGPDIVIGPGFDEAAKGIYELKAEIPDYSPMLASVSVRVRKSWSLDTYAWSNKDNLAPVYMGLELGLYNTGVFAFLRDNGTGGSLVLGGPLQSFGSERGWQVEMPLAWTGLADGDVLSVFFYVDPVTMKVSLWKQAPSDPAPVFCDNLYDLSIPGLGTFLPESSAFPQRRSGTSQSATLYFGNCGGPGDVVEFRDFAIYPFFSTAVVNGYPTVGHSLYKRPDLPLTYFSGDRVLPNAPGVGRWIEEGVTDVKFWFQPGRKTVPLYTTIHKAAAGYGRLTRIEPHLTGRATGFSVEAWMSGVVASLPGPDVGIGLRVEDGLNTYQISAIDTELNRSYGILKSRAYANLDVAEGYYRALDSEGEMRRVDYHSLMLLRLTMDRARAKVNLFIEDMDTPFLSIPMDADHPFPPASQAEGTVSVGHIDYLETVGDCNVASLSFMNNYLAWEAVDELLPEVAPAPFTFFTVGDGAAALPPYDGTKAAALRLEKKDYGVGSSRSTYYWRPFTANYARGFQVDFRVRVASYTDINGVSNAPNQWTGAGLTAYLGVGEAPEGDAWKIHIGFFDCGVHGRKIGIIPGKGTIQDIIDQTPLGAAYSVDVDWMTMRSYRFVYRPFHQVELWGPNFIKDAPLLIIPWADFFGEVDLDHTDANLRFGLFNSEVSCKTEWEYLRWGVSSGYDVAIQQPVPSPVPDTAFDARELVVITCDEVENQGGGIP